MMRMVMTTPNVLKDSRSEWLGPFNFFLFPLLSELLGGYSSGFDKSRRHQSFDGQTYQIAMSPTEKQDKVIPDSFRIVLNRYLKKPEVKSLAPDGSPCTGVTQGMFGRTEIFAGELIPINKETARRWDVNDPAVHV
jgi:hypothetical protein